MVVTRSSWYKAPWELSMHSGKIVIMLPASTETLTLARFFSTRLKPCKSIIVELIPSHNSVGQVSQDFFHLVMKFLFIQDQNLHKSEIGTRYTSTVKVTAVSKKEKKKRRENLLCLKCCFLYNYWKAAHATHWGVGRNTVTWWVGGLTGDQHSIDGNIQGIDVA